MEGAQIARYLARAFKAQNFVAQGARLFVRNFAQQKFYLAYGLGRHAEFRHPHSQKKRRENRIRRELPANARGYSRFQGGRHHHVERADNRGVGGLVEVGDEVVYAVNRQKVLNEVVGAYAYEVAFGGYDVRRERRARNLYHTPELQVFVERLPFLF